ncbi:MAG: hypothetical protein LC793_10905, partial [Thermomicrobia bacterium]|nr:hypothetical protein [Thermomicrobia bacterium]MCA1723895.1 hypothetical protein [Thermomicrobia bacterium]
LAARLKGDLAALFSLDPTAADDAFVGALHTRRPDLAAECAALLTALGTPAKNAAAFVALAQRGESLRHHALEARVVAL